MKLSNYFHIGNTLAQSKYAHGTDLSHENYTNSLQYCSNSLLLDLSGVETHETSSDNNTNKSVKCNENKANSYDCIYTTVLEKCRLLQLVYWCAFQHIINTLLALIKLFCFVGWCREYKSYFGSKYLQLDWFLVSNRPINFE